MESESSDGRYFHSIVFAAPDDPHDLAEVLAEIVGIHPTDAIVHARNATGILPDRQSREKADRLAAAVNSLGLHAESISAGEVPDFGHGEAVHHVHCPETKHAIFGLRGGLNGYVPWDEIELICAGVVPQETSKHHLTNEIATLSAARRTFPARHEVALSAGTELWFIQRSPFQAYHVDHKLLNYE